jgi:hypothetical protein
LPIRATTRTRRGGQGPAYMLGLMGSQSQQSRQERLNCCRRVKLRDHRPRARSAVSRQEVGGKSAPAMGATHAHAFRGGMTTACLPGQAPVLRYATRSPTRGAGKPAWSCSPTMPLTARIASPGVSFGVLTGTRGWGDGTVAEVPGVLAVLCDVSPERHERLIQDAAEALVGCQNMVECPVSVRTQKTEARHTAALASNTRSAGRCLLGVPLLEVSPLRRVEEPLARRSPRSELQRGRPLAQQHRARPGARKGPLSCACQQGQRLSMPGCRPIRSVSCFWQPHRRLSCACLCYMAKSAPACRTSAR